MLVKLSLTVVKLLWAYYNRVSLAMTSLLYDAVAINRNDVVELLIELCCWAHICARRTGVR